jgi:hypothetical protein
VGRWVDDRLGNRKLSRDFFGSFWRDPVEEKGLETEEVGGFSLGERRDALLLPVFPLLYHYSLALYHSFRLIARIKGDSREGRDLENSGIFEIDRKYKKYSDALKVRVRDRVLAKILQREFYFIFDT